MPHLRLCETFDDHPSAEKDQQHERDPVIPLQHELAGEHPHPQPTSGVSVSMAPKINPVRSASENLGLCKVAPLPIEAAKASMDMPKARRIVAEMFIIAS